MMKMKRWVAGAALVTSIFGTATAALADTTDPNATTTLVQTTATTSTQTETQSPAPATTTTSAQTGAEATTTTTATTTADASTALPEVSLTPDKLFYSLKLWVEKIQLLITTDAANKAALLEAQAQTRLAEAKAMAEAGKADLATAALNEAAAKLEAAKAAIDKAADSNKDISKLSAMIEADQAKFAVALSVMIEKAPDEVKAQVEPMIADLLVQVATNADAAAKDETAAEEAAKVAEEAKLEAELGALQPRMVLVLDAMAKASGKDLKDVLGMYQKNPGLGRIAKELGVKMGPVQHAAQAEWKKGGKVEIELTAPTTPAPTTTANTDATATATVTAPATAQVEVQEEEQVQIAVPGLSISVKGKANVEHGKGQAKQNGNNGNGKGKGH